MKKLVLIIVVSSFLSCSQDKEKQLGDSLKTIVLDYQKKYPFKDYENNQKGKKYVYTVSFLKDNNDTLVRICRSTNGVLPNEKGFGIYKDDILKETFVYDDKQYSKNFILKEIKHVDKSYYANMKGAFYESYPPMYSYKVKSKELNLIRIDTFWKHWD
jgi:hypothetical protein